MLDLGAAELLLIVIVAVIVIGPKDLPLAMRTAGRWMAKVRRVSSHFRSGIDAMIREAELEEMEKQWKAQNEAIMKASPESEAKPEDMQAPAASAEGAIASAEGTTASAEGAATPSESGSAHMEPLPASEQKPGDTKPEPQLPLPPP